MPTGMLALQWNVVVGTMELQIRLDGCFNLKDKRRVLRSLTDRARRDLHVSIAEVDDNDLWNQATVGVACVSGDATIIDTILSRVLEMFDDHPEVAVENIDREVARR